MYISIQFKDRNKVFKGKTYDYKLHSDESVPPVGSIVRLMDEDYDYIHYGTRTKVVSVKEQSSTATMTVRYVEASLD